MSSPEYYTLKNPVTLAEARVLSRGWDLHYFGEYGKDKESQRISVNTLFEPLDIEDLKQKLKTVLAKHFHPPMALTGNKTEALKEIADTRNIGLEKAINEILAVLGVTTTGETK